MSVIAVEYHYWHRTSFNDPSGILNGVVKAILVCLVVSDLTVTGGRCVFVGLLPR